MLAFIYKLTYIHSIYIKSNCKTTFCQYLISKLSAEKEPFPEIINSWKSFWFNFFTVSQHMNTKNILLKCTLNGDRFCCSQTSPLLFFCRDYDANIFTLNKETIATAEMRDVALWLTKARKGITRRQVTVGQSVMHRPANTIT